MHKNSLSSPGELRARFDQLPQALLAKAFRGELVPQDPAGELLERIQAGKAASPGTRKRK